MSGDSMSLLDIPMLVPRLVLMARASSAVYEPDLAKRQAELEALGLTWIGVTRRPDRDITVLRWTGPLAPVGGANLSVTQGTCFSANTNPREILADINVLPMDTPNGPMPRGFWETVPQIAPDVYAMGDPLLPWHHAGHSLGGETAQILLAEIPGTAWPINPPTGASHKFWRHVVADSRNTIIPLVNEREFAHGYMVGLDWHQPAPFLWLHHGQLLEVSGRDGINIDEDEHFIDTTLVNLLGLPGAIERPAVLAGDA